MTNLKQFYVDYAEHNYLKTFNTFLFHRIKYYLDQSILSEEELTKKIFTYLDPTYSQKDLIERLSRLNNFTGRFIIIIPTRNRLPNIKHLIEGLIKNSYKDWILLLIDNGEDNTYKIVETEYPEKVIGLPLNQIYGCAFLARNIGIDVLDLATRKRDTMLQQYIIFIDSDDEIASSTALEELNTLIEKNSADGNKVAMVNGYCSYEYMYEDGSIKKGTYPEYFTEGKPSVNNLAEFFDKGPNILSAATHISYIVNMRYPEEFSFEDNGFNHKLIFRINKAGDRIYAENFPVVNKYWGVTSMAGDNDKTGNTAEVADLCGINVKGLRAKIVKYLQEMSEFFRENGV